ncbi:hypothetical protein [Chryseobacterium vrystaatense]|nr:hypothetical protein [Chryseobacterium vrystaatense]
MKKIKNLLWVCTLLLSAKIYCQIGIHTANPAATLDIASKNSTGLGRDVEGILIPRVDRQRAQSMNNVPVSTMVYVNDVSTGTQTDTAKNIDTSGFYYFSDANVWTKVSTPASTGNIFVPTVVAAGNATNSFTQNFGSGFARWTFTAYLNDGNWNTADNTYIVPKTGFYQLSLQGIMQPSSDLTNSFTWYVKYDNNYYDYRNITGVENIYTYISGGMLSVFLSEGQVIEFGAIPCNRGNCPNNSYYTITDRSFVITYLGT